MSIESRPCLQAALNIMRGRDNGLADYNTVRKCHGLERITDFAEVNPYLNATDPDIFVKGRIQQAKEKWEIKSQLCC